jgi:anti-sigma B factor antagonist
LHQNQLRKPNNMTFAQEIKGDNLILHITGDLIGEDNGTQLVSAVNDAMTHKVLTCIIDISDLRYINSSGIGVLITILTKFRNKGGEVYLMNPSESVKKLLVITKLNAIFQVIKSEAEAVSKK